MKAPWLNGVLDHLEMRLVSWKVRFATRGSMDPERLARTLRSRLVPGSILMLHDGHDRRSDGNPAVLELLPRVLETLSSLGYRSEPLP